MTWLWITIAVVLDGAVALVGGLLPERWLDRYQPAMLGFAAGTLLASGLGEILPEAISIDGVTVLGWTAGAMLVLGGFEHASARRERHRQRPVVPVALLGSDALHNLADGMAIAAAFVISPRVGILTSAAVLIHELPEEIADYALLRVAAWRSGARWSRSLRCSSPPCSARPERSPHQARSRAQAVRSWGSRAGCSCTSRCST